MPIRVQCVHCGKSFSAWDDLIGKSVQCPKCKQQMTVTRLGDAAPAAKSKSAAPSAGRRTSKKKASSPAQPAPTPPKRSPRKASKGTRQVPPPPPPPPAQKGPPATLTPTPRQRRVEHEDDFDDSESLPIGCPNCGQPLPAQEELCDNCGYHTILKKVIDLDGVRRPDKSTGFERVIKRQLSENESADSMLLWAKIVGGFFALVFLLCLGPYWWIGAGLIGAGVIFYYLKVRPPTGGDEASVNVDLLSQLVWQSLLTVQRTIGWRSLDWPFPACRTIVLRDASFGDEDLSELQNLADFQAIDLEGTQLSNDGLAFLEDQRQLRYIVIRQTRVTAEGVQRLQQALPQTWIWG